MASRPLGVEALEQRQMLSVTLDLRSTSGGKSVSVSSVGQQVTLDVYAVITGNTSGANDGFSSGTGSFISSKTNSTTSVAGNLVAHVKQPQYAGLGASEGTIQDLNGDGSLDVGSNNNSDIAGFFSDRSGAVIQDGVVSGNTQTLLIGTVTYTVTNLADGQATNVNFRLRNGIQSGAFDAVWVEDGNAKNDQSGTVLLGAPVVITDPSLTVPSPGSISGTVSKVVNGSTSGFSGTSVYLDANNNGVLDSGETSVLTNSSGAYTFSGLVAGSYSVREVVPSGYTQTSPSSTPTRVTLGTGQNVTGENFTDTLSSTGTGSKLTGATIGTSGSYLNDGNTIAKAVDGNLTTFFDAPTLSGDWVGLDLGTPKVITSVAYTARSGFSSRMNGGVFQASDSATFTSGVVNLYTIPANTNPSSTSLTPQSVNSGAAYRYVRYLSPNGGYGNVAEVQFFGTGGTTPPGTGSISGAITKIVSGASSADAGVTVYLDINNNGSFDSGDVGTTTNSAGAYTFSGLAAGTYRVRQVVASGYNQTSPTSSPTTVTLASGQSATGENFIDTASSTNPAPMTLTVNVFNDLNKNGVRDGGEVGLRNWTAYVDSNNNGRLDSGESVKATDSNGTFSFTALRAGTYTLRIVPQTGYTTTTAAFYTVTISPGNPATVTFGEHKN